MGLDIGAFTFFLYAFYQREVIYDIFETLSGHSKWSLMRASSAMIVRRYLHRGVSSMPSSFSTAPCQATSFAIGEM